RTLAAASALGIAAAPAALPLGAVRDAAALDVAIVQGNVPRGYFEGLRRGRAGPEDEVIIANHVRLTETLSGDPPDLVIWPENALDRDPFTDQVARDGVDVALGLTRTPLLVGAILDGPRPNTFYNANLLFSPDGTVLGRYDKVRLVPFGEYVPWSWARRVVPSLEQVPTDGVPGRGPVVMDLPSGDRFGTVICFESSYPHLSRELARRGAEMIVVSTNTATFERSPLARQHLALSRMRAVETGRPVVHAGIAGISAVIRPDGRIVRRAGLFVPAIVREPVLLATGRTPYVEHGEVTDTALGIAAGACAAAAALIAWRRRPGGDIDEEDEVFWRAGTQHGREANGEEMPTVATASAAESEWEQRE
ncbi:MAG: apolipoprotein N-acyltransferase, partial [Actinomycetota bacterium]